MKMRVAITAGLSFGIALSLHAQSAGASKTKGGKVSVSVVDPPGSPQRATFAIPESDMVVQYSPDFRKEDPEQQRSFRASFGDPKDGEKDGCYPIHIQVGAGNPLIHYEPEDSKHFSPEPPTGGLTLQEVMRRCKAADESDDDFVAGIVAVLRKRQGFTPAASMIDYDIDKAHVILSIVSADTKDADGKRRASAGKTLIAMIGVLYQGRMFLFTATANDVAILNQLLTVRLQFHNDLPWPLVPFQLGQGGDEKMKDIVPK